MCQPGAYGHWGLCSTLRVWAGGWTPVNTGGKTKLPVQNYRKGKTMEPSSPLPAISRKTSRSCLVGLKSAGGGFLFFFFLPSVRQSDLELWKDQRQIQREIRRLMPTTETKFASLSYRTCILFFVIIFTIILFLFLLYSFLCMLYCLTGFLCSPFHIEFQFLFLHLVFL